MSFLQIIIISLVPVTKKAALARKPPKYLKPLGVQ